MDDEEFNALVNRATEGLPVTLVVTRLMLMLRALVDDLDGAPSVLRAYVQEWMPEDEC